MNKKEILLKMQKPVEDRGCFITDLSVSRDNDIELTIEKDFGSVDLQDCEAINDVFLETFDRDVEDYALTVSSAGLDQPFKVLRQFTKAIGSQVEVWLRNGRKLVGVLTEADEEGITLRYSSKEAVEGKKKKVIVEHEDRFGKEEFNSVMPHIVFDRKQ